MSYILDALRKAERDHQVSRIPTLATAHGGAEVRRASWMWPVATAVLAVAVIAAYTVRWAPIHPIREVPATTGLATPPPDPGSAPSVEPAPPSPAASAGGPVAGQAAVSPAPGEVVSPPTMASTPVPSRPDSTVSAPPLKRAPSNPSSPAGPAAKRVAASRTPGELTSAPLSHRGAPRAATVPAEPRPTTTARAGPSAALVNPPPDTVAAWPAPAVPIEREPVRALDPTRDTVAQPAVATIAAPDGGVGKVTSAPPLRLAAPAAPAAPAPGFPRLALDVLVYSDVPAERFVFINGRKYVEGQAVEGDAVIEQITPDGALLRQAGSQIMLRPKLNPYARPGSP